jgi:hemolysin activation/secretion protein
MSRTRLLTAIAFICLFFGWLELYEQPIPQTAGDVLRQIEEKTSLPVVDAVEAVTGSAVPKPNIHAGSGKNIQQIMQEELAERKAIEEAQAEGKLVVTLSQINFQGVSILGDLELKEAVAKYLNVPMNYEQMLEIGMTVESYYRQHNYLARVILPPQDLSSGVLQLDVIESVVSKVEVEQKLEELPNTQAHVLALIAAQQAQGEYLNTKSVERGLALANDVPGVSVQASLKEGDKAGDTEVLLKMYQTRSMDSDITIDNAGSRSTGAERLMATLNVFNPNDIQDLLNLVGVHTKGSDYVRTAYSVPIGVAGWRIGANVSLMKYQVILGDIGVVGAFGEAVTRGLEWTYPLLRSNEANSTVTLNADTKRFKNTSAYDRLMSDTEARVLSAQVAGFYRNLDPDGGSGTYLVQFSQGRINLLDGDLKPTDATGAQTEGAFGKVKTTLTWQQPVTTQTSTYVAYTAQFANRNLDSSEKMQLGGMNGVRAYPTGEGSGSDGQLLQLELRHNLENGFAITGFYDWGQVWQFHDPNFGAAPPNNQLTYQGFGASIGYTTPSGMSIKAIWARRREENPNPNPINGKDQDGSYDRNRYWLQLNVPF